FHHAGSALVCLGVAVRHTARDPASGLRTERGGLVVRVAGRRDFRALVFATDAAWYRPAFGGCAHAAGGGGLDDSPLCASAYRKLAFFSALVCCSGSVGRLGVRTPAALASLVLSRLDVTLGESAWRMAVRHGAARNLRAGCVREESPCARCDG